MYLVTSFIPNDIKTETFLSQMIALLIPFAFHRRNMTKIHFCVCLFAFRKEKRNDNWNKDFKGKLEFPSFNVNN